MKILVHICCGPCSITVLQAFQERGVEVTGLFVNPNIQPLSEYLKRREGAERVASRLGVKLIMADTLPFEEQEWTDPLGWLPPLPDSLANPSGNAPKSATQFSLAHFPPALNPEQWLKSVALTPDLRCGKCLYVRLAKTAQLAKKWGFTAFTSSLLFSKHQNHQSIQSQSIALSKFYGLDFEYGDFRKTWQHGVELSKEWGIYRQSYCGCMYSEYQRYQKSFTNLLEKKVVPSL